MFLVYYSGNDRVLSLSLLNPGFQIRGLSTEGPPQSPGSGPQQPSIHITWDRERNQPGHHAAGLIGARGLWVIPGGLRLFIVHL